MISDCNLYIDETSGISPFEVRTRARRLKAQVGLDLIMIDYLQLMDLKLKVESRERAVSEISKSLKSLAKELRFLSWPWHSSIEVLREELKSGPCSLTFESPDLSSRMPMSS